MKLSAATVMYAVAAALMVVVIGAITFTGRWPNDAPLDRTEMHGIISVPADRVARVEMGTADKLIAFDRGRAGGWLVDGVPTDGAISEHIDAGIRMFNVSAPRRVLGPDEYGAEQIAEYGLDPPRLMVTMVESGGKTTHFELGDDTPAQNSQYVRVVGRSKVYLLARHVGVEWQLALDMQQRAATRGPSASGEGPRSGALLLPVSIAQVWAIEFVANGSVYRFERDPAGAWFHHVGQHVHTLGGFVHHADPKLAPMIAKELAGLDQSPVEQVIARHPDLDALAEVDLEHPPWIMVMYSRDSSQPVARVEFGKTAADGFHRFARVRETDLLVTVPTYETEHVTKLLRLAGATS